MKTVFSAVRSLAIKALNIYSMVHRERSAFRRAEAAARATALLKAVHSVQALVDKLNLDFALTPQERDIYTTTAFNDLSPQVSALEIHIGAATAERVAKSLNDVWLSYCGSISARRRLETRMQALADLKSALRAELYG